MGLLDDLVTGIHRCRNRWDHRRRAGYCRAAGDHRLTWLRSDDGGCLDPWTGASRGPGSAARQIHRGLGASGANPKAKCRLGNCAVVNSDLPSGPWSTIPPGVARVSGSALCSSSGGDDDRRRGRRPGPLRCGDTHTRRTRSARARGGVLAWSAGRRVARLDRLCDSVLLTYKTYRDVRHRVSPRANKYRSLLPHVRRPGAAARPRQGLALREPGAARLGACLTEMRNRRPSSGRIDRSPRRCGHCGGLSRRLMGGHARFARGFRRRVRALVG